MTEKLKVVLVDDQCLCRRGLSELLANCYDFNVLGATGSIDELREICLAKPDLLIVDLRMKPMDGIALINQLRSEGCSIPAVMLTMSDSEIDLANAIRAALARSAQPRPALRLDGAQETARLLAELAAR